MQYGGGGGGGPFTIEIARERREEGVSDIELLKRGILRIFSNTSNTFPTLRPLPPLKFHRVGGCWYRT
jgi:hypothetical protein